MGGLKNAPDVPDVADTVNAQTGTNINTAKTNAKFGYVGSITPYGETKLKKTGTTKYTDPYTGETYKVPKFSEKVKLTEEGQKQFDLQQGTITNLLNLANTQSAQLGDYLSTPFKLGDFNFGADLGVGTYQPGESLDSQVYSGDPLTLGNDATEARLFELGSARLDPKFEQEKASLQSDLLSRGIREGTAAWNAAMGNFNQGKNDAYNELLLSGRGQAANEMMAEWQAGLTGQGQTFNQLLQSRGLGMQEQGQQFTQALADRQRLLAEREQQTGEAFAERSQPINEIAALLGTGQVTVPQVKGYSTTQIPTTDVAGLINTNWDQQFQAWQAESAATQNLLGGLFGAAGNIFASDERIKQKGDVVGTTAEGLPIYEFKVGDGETQTGVMAQDVEKQNPGAVIDTPAGIKAVDYGMAVGDGDGTYTVKKGDNLTKIGKRFNTPLDQIIAANPQISDPDRIMPGDKIKVPGLAAPGPEAIPYDPLSSAFQPPADGSGIPAVIEALQPEAQSIMADAVFTPPALEPWEMDAVRQFDAARRGGAVPQANDIDTMTQVDDTGIEAVAGDELFGPGTKSGLAQYQMYMPPEQYGPGNEAGRIRYDNYQIGQDMRRDAAEFGAAQDSRFLAGDLGFRRAQMEHYMPAYRPPPAAPPAPAPVPAQPQAPPMAPPVAAPPPPAGPMDPYAAQRMPGSLAAHENFQMPEGWTPSGPPAVPFRPPSDQAYEWFHGHSRGYTNEGGAFPPDEPAIAAPDSAVPPSAMAPPGPQPSPYQFQDAFDTPAGRAEILDLLEAFQRMKMFNPTGAMMRAGIGGF